MSEKTIYSTIVVGLGRIGLGYDLASASDEVFSHTKALLRHPSFTLIAGVDKHVDRRKDFSSFTGLQAYQSCQEALEKSQTVDICVVATPSKDRMNAIREALQLEPRFLVLEKPLALTLEEGREIVDLIRQRKIGAYVNYIRRADPAVLALSSDIAKGRMGHIFNVVVHYSKGLLNNGSHYLSVCLDWFGHPLGVDVLRSRVCGQCVDDWDVDFILHYEQFDIHFLASDERCYSVGEIDMLTETGRLRYANFGERIWWHRIELDQSFPDVKSLVEEPYRVQPDMKAYQLNVYSHVSALMAANPASTTGLSHALDVLTIGNSVIDQVRKG